ncbi:MAG: histidinol-phosphate transaminase [Melioribacteraceae bacterium]|nr:histidinol-phosphate transaminase [Melioribacteraceae bacterium]
MSMIEMLVRENIKRLKPYTSARDSHLNGILLDANENSFGSVVENELELNRYPDPSQKKLRQKLSSVIGIDYSKIFLGVGSDEIIDLLVRVFCEPKEDNVVIPEPTYGMYKVVCDINNVSSFSVELNNSFQLDVAETLSLCNEKTKMLFLCSPNNPTGNVLRKSDIEEICRSFKGIVVVDEAYYDFDTEYSLESLLYSHRNIVLLRTFSKAWGLAGARCGYCLADKEVISYLYKVKAPYNLNKLTTDIVMRALDNTDKRDKFINMIKVERQRIINALRKNKKVLNVFDSNANFILFEIENAKSVYDQLAREGVIIRDRSSQINLKNCLRVSVGKPEENDKFIKSIQELT